MYVSSRRGLNECFLVRVGKNGQGTEQWTKVIFVCYALASSLTLLSSRKFSKTLAVEPHLLGGMEISCGNVCAHLPLGESQQHTHQKQPRVRLAEPSKERMTECQSRLGSLRSQTW